MSQIQWVLWGFSSSNPMPIKLMISDARSVKAEKKIRESQGWTCAIYKPSDEPTRLRLQAAQEAEERGTAS